MDDVDVRLVDGAHAALLGAHALWNCFENARHLDAVARPNSVHQIVEAEEGDGLLGWCVAEGTGMSGDVHMSHRCDLRPELSLPTCGVSPSGISSGVSCSRIICLSEKRQRLCTI